MSESAHEPLRHAEARAVAVNPDSPAVIASALRTVVLFTLADSFALVPEETLWASYHLERIFAPLHRAERLLVPLAVRQEMLPPHAYSRALAGLESGSATAPVAPFDSQSRHASEADWAAVIMHMVTESFALRPLDEATMRGQIAGVLRELGVGHPTDPRAARYLPNDVRHRLNSAA